MFTFLSLVIVTGLIALSSSLVVGLVKDIKERKNAKSEKKENDVNGNT